MRTALFLLLKEYTDGVEIPSAPYIQAEDCLDETKWLDNYKLLIDVIDYFRYEKCDRFFDINNLVHATFPFDLLKDYYEERDEYPCTSDNILVQIAFMGFVNWREMYVKDDQQYFYYDIDVTDDTLGEIARNIHMDNAVILLNMDAIRHSSPLRLTYANGNSLVEIEHVDCIKGLHEWFSVNRKPQRVFVYSSKHGDFYKQSEMISGSGRRAAQLECLKVEAQKLLEQAVGNDVNSSMWFYDSKYHKHIYFENQNEIRLAFHGYHLKENEENFSNISIDKLTTVLGERYDI